MTYDLIADGEQVNVGDRQYLLSPQDLSGLPVLPALIESGVACLKIEGRLKAPEYVANVTRVYRDALDRVAEQFAATRTEPPTYTPSADERYRLEMAFSRGLYTGWFEGIDNQALVHARFAKKRGVLLGEVRQVQKEGVVLKLQAPVKAGDGIVFDNGHPAAGEEGGRVYAVERRGKHTLLTFGRRDLNLKRVNVGDKVWKTSDPELDKTVRQSYAGESPQFQRPIALEIHGEVDQPLVAIARDAQGHIAQAESEMPLVTAHHKPLSTDKLTQQFGRLGNTPFRLDYLTNHVQGDVMLPVSELNRLRRELVGQLEVQRSQPQRWQLQAESVLSDLMPPPSDPAPDLAPEPIALVRNRGQLEAAIAADLSRIYCEFENPATYKATVDWFREHRRRDDQTIWVAPPRITKPLENYILEQVGRSQADGYLVRNYDHLQYFADQPCIGDFSLNVANPLTADYFRTRYGLERLTASYDLNIDQLEALLQASPANWFEITLHQHMPMFHMEHCVFCAFLSDGKDFRDCGRPCEQHEVKLRDRTGTEHILHADAGCRNTLYNGIAQTGAEYAQRLLKAGARHFRIEFLSESPAQVAETLERYRQLLSGELSGAKLWKTLKLQSKLGVTRGPLDKAHR
jgi:putative protease